MGVSSNAWWKSDRWSLCAPASYVLRNGQNASGVEAFKLGLLELVARGTLKIVKQEETSGLLRRKREVSYVVSGSGAERPEELSLAAVFDVHTRSEARTLNDGTSAVLLADLVKRAREDFGTIQQYTHRIVLQELVGRGLFAVKPRNMLRFIRWTAYELTRQGYVVRGELEVWATTGQKELPGLVERDPAKAVAFAALAGSTVFLTASLYPELARLGDRVRDSGYDDASSFYLASSSDASTDGGFQFPQLDFGAFDFGFDFSGLDGLSDISTDIDSGVSDAGGDGGGGDGDGDGGGGGGD
jgi:hypothetical protein